MLRTRDKRMKMGSMPLYEFKLVRAALLRFLGALQAVIYPLETLSFPLPIVEVPARTYVESM
jgi:hypothetical protein